MSICVCKTLVTPLQHFVVALLGTGAVGSCGVVVLVAGHWVVPKSFGRVAGPVRLA